jgi:hypothetical protein
LQEAASGRTQGQVNKGSPHPDVCKMSRGNSLHDPNSGKRDSDGVGQLLLPRVGPRSSSSVHPVEGDGRVDDNEHVGELELFSVPLKSAGETRRDERDA